MDNGYCMVARPTLAQRFWRWLGFGKYDGPELPARCINWPGWAATTVIVQVSPLDRLRLLLLGRMRVHLRQASPQPIEDVITAAAVQIVSPVDGEWRAPQ